MSFMFKPLPYDDPRAVNHPKISADLAQGLTFGTAACGRELAAAAAQKAKDKGCALVIDGYASAQFEALAGAAAQQLRQRGLTVDVRSMNDLYRPAQELERLVADSLPHNYEEDPVLLFGKIFQGSFADFIDPEKAAALKNEIESLAADTVLLLTGLGSSFSTLQSERNIVAYIDVTPKTAAIRAREGRLVNIGDKAPRPFSELMRRNYFVDFEIILSNRKRLLQQNELDFYLCGDQDADFILMSGQTLTGLLHTLACYPFRTKPVYLEGIWGGEFIRKVRGLPMDSKNVAWVFDMIPMEVSIVLEAAGRLVEFPFFTFIQKCPRQIMGERCAKEFGGYFPIRFNYDDTWHSDGNMSIQVHPEKSICTREYNELGGQDEAYYIIAAGHGAKTYAGFETGADTKEFLERIKQSEKNGSEVDYQKYISHLDSVPGRQIMLPGGTIHASGRNQLILELGSLTVGSYTYKLYDYNRRDSLGNARPIHSVMGERVLHEERDTNWVRENIAIAPIPDGQGEGWKQTILGKTDLMYYMTRQLDLKTGARAEFSNSGQFTVLTLVDGEAVKIYSKSNPDFSFEQSFLDIVVVPATIEDYVIENIGYQPAIVHKTMLKEDYKGF